MEPAYRYRAYAERVHDGDTYQLRVDLGFDVAISISARLHGVNAPELNTEQGKAARDYVRALLTPGAQTAARALIVQSYRDTRSFARWVCDIWMSNDQGEAIDLAQALVAAGMAKPFDPATDHWTR